MFGRSRGRNRARRLLRLGGALAVLVVMLLGSAVAAGASSERRNAAQLGVSALVGDTPSPARVKKILYRAAHDFLAGHRRVRTDLEDQGTLWRWDDAQKTLSSRLVDEPTVAAANAARIAHALQEVDPQDRRLLRMKAVAVLQRDKLVGGLDKPIDPAAARAVLEG